MSINKAVLANVAGLGLLALAGSAGAAAVYNYDGGVGNGTWKDVNKANPLTSVQCWACAAANNLAWTGWPGWDSGTSSYIASEGDIFNYFDASWGNVFSSPFYGYQWWFSGNEGDPDSSPVAGSGNFYPGAYNPLDPPANNPIAFFPSTQKQFAEDNIAFYINADRGVAITIEGSSDAGVNYLHTLTVWGIDVDLDKIWITDSDDEVTALIDYDYVFNSVTNSWFIDGYSNAYTTDRDFEILDIVRLNLNVEGIEPDKGEPSGIPEPATLALFALGLAGLGTVRRRKSAA